jgi:hypothetical protein
MDRRGTNTWLVAALALAVGFLAALLIFGGNDNNNSSATVSQTTAAAGTGTGAGTTQAATTPATTTTSTTATATATTPTSPQATEASCLDLWNQSTNRTNQVFLLNVMTRQAVRVHVGTTSDVPPKCLVTVVANDGSAYVFPEGGGTTYPYAQVPGSTPSSSLPSGQRISNALEQRDGTLAAR